MRLAANVLAPELSSMIVVIALALNAQPIGGGLTAAVALAAYGRAALGAGLGQG